MSLGKKIQEVVGNFTRLAADSACQAQVERAAEWIVTAIRAGGKILVCGNGGSAADAQHFVGEFLCRFYHDRQPFPALALTTDSSVLTAIANDYSYDEVFQRQVDGLGKAGDLLLGISTSGSSRNVLRAFEAAKKRGIRTILLTGATERELARACDLCITVPSTDTPRIQEMHLAVEHLICEMVEQAMVAGQ